MTNATHKTNLPNRPLEDETQLLKLRAEACRSLAIVLIDIAREKLAQPQSDQQGESDEGDVSLTPTAS